MDEKPSIPQQHIEDKKINHQIQLTYAYTYDDEDFCYNYYIWNSNLMKKRYKIWNKNNNHNIFCT